MNRVELVGRIARDIELTYIPGSGTAVVKSSLAVDEYDYKAKENKAVFIPITVWGKQAESLAQHMGKGGLISVTGRIRPYSYDAKDGTKRYAFEVVADNVNGIRFLSKANSSNNGGYNPSTNNGGYNPPANNGGYNAPKNTGGYNTGYNNKNQGANQAASGFGNGFDDFGMDMTPVDDGDMPF